ncbi:MAG: hypothetical protein EHM57_01570 [Actinobacteria bacterium]|nr:MAG: hypothetical protein EHM57_01570 [Actinomycetota bacterium]
MSFGFVIAVFTMIWAVSPELSSDAFGLILATPRLVAVYDVNLLILLTLAVFVFPVSIWVAIARYRLFDIELIVNRALVYGTITGLVALGVLAVGAVLALVFGVGDERTLSPAQAAIVGATMGASFIATFRPLRLRVQRGVDRRFYREKYAVDRAIEAFAARTEAVVELEELVDGVRTVIEDGFHPERLEVWHPVASHVSLEPAAAEALLARGESVTLSSEPGPLLGLHGDGYLAAVPFVSQGRLAGAALIGSRRGGPYSALDLELLDRLAHRVAPAFRLGELVRRQEQNAMERQRLAGEMEAARRIQVELLPKELPRLDGWTVDAFYRPAREVGGDFYDFMPLRDGRIAIVVGDVTGKGIPAAMVMTTCRTLLRGATGDEEGSPGRVLAQVNDLLRTSIPAGMFVTCLFGILEPDNGTFLFANAGHDLPYLKRGAEAIEVRATGMPLGLLPDMRYDEAEITLRSGETLLLSTDGLVEVHAPGGDMLGFPRFGRMVAAAPDELALIPALLEAQRDFTGLDWEQEDDITMLMFHRR